MSGSCDRLPDMNRNAKRIHKAVSPLQNRIFGDREELDDAVFPHFGQLIDIFEGQSHRDLVDKLIVIGWVVKNQMGGSWEVRLPEIDRPEKYNKPPEKPVPEIHNEFEIEVQKKIDNLAVQQRAVERLSLKTAAWEAIIADNFDAAQTALDKLKNW